MKRAHIKSEETEGGINMSPLIDLVFILLIFFIVAAVFLSEEGVVVSNAPKALSKNENEEGPILLRLDRLGHLIFESNIIEKGGMGALIQQRNPGSSRTVVLEVEEGVSSGDAVGILDLAYLSGAESVKITEVR